MSADTGEPLIVLEIRERLARLDQLIGDVDRKRRDIDIKTFWVNAIGAAAALLGAGAALGVFLATALS